MTIEAFNLAERFRVPVFLMADEAVAHLRERVNVATGVTIFNRTRKAGMPPFGTQEEDGVPPMPAFGDGANLLITGSTHNEWGVRKTDDPIAQARLVDRINRKILDRQEDIIQTESYLLDDAEIAIVSYGFTARSARFAVHALRKEGIKIGLVRLKTIWPFAGSLMKEVGLKVKKLFVPEMNRGQMAQEVRKHASCEVISYSQTDGEIIHPDRIIDEVRCLL